MIRRRLALAAALPVLAFAREAATPAAAAPAAEPNCGDPGGRFIACSAVALPAEGAARRRCPLCGGLHARGAEPQPLLPPVKRPEWS
jgi:hypothetical protein